MSRFQSGRWFRDLCCRMKDHRHPRSCYRIFRKERASLPIDIQRAFPIKHGTVAEKRSGRDSRELLSSGSNPAGSGSSFTQAVSFQEQLMWRALCTSSSPLGGVQTASVRKTIFLTGSLTE